MRRVEFLAAAVAASASPHPVPAPTRGVWADVTLEREGSALLAPFTVASCAPMPLISAAMLISVPIAGDT